MLGRTHIAIAVATALACTVGGCSSSPPLVKPQDWERLARISLKDPSANWPVPPPEAERKLGSEKFEIRSVKDAGGGVTGAKKFELFFPSDGKVIAAKWKVAPGSLDGWNNSPRKELAAYDIQRWFLDPEDYVVPTTVVRCIPLDEYRRFEPRASANVDGAKCVLGVLTLWMNDVTVPPKLYEEHLFTSDPNYAYRMANFNLLTFLIDHRDGRAGNFLVSKDSEDRRVFAVDNGISFGSWIYNYFVPNWNEIEVPAVRRASVQRLRGITFGDVHRLQIGIELRMDDDGILRPVEPGPNLGPSEGVRQRPGVVQLGLDGNEIEEVAAKVADLLDDLDEGDFGQF